MLSSYFARGGVLDESESIDSPTPPDSSSLLRHTRSTSALKVITPLQYQRPPTMSPANEASRPALLSPNTPSPTGYLTPSPTECSLPSPSFSSLASPISPSPNYGASLSSPAPDNDSSFAHKIRFHLSSAMRKPGALPFLQITHSFRNDDSKTLEMEVKSCATRPGRSMSISTTGNVPDSLEATNTCSPFELQRATTKPNLDIIKGEKQSSSKTFSAGELVAKAHKKIFGRTRGSDAASGDNSTVEDDVNSIYSSIPLEFPTSEDDGNGFIIVSPVQTDFRNHPFALTPRKTFSSLPVQPLNPLPIRRVPLPSTPCSSSFPRIA